MPNKKDTSAKEKSATNNQQNIKKEKSDKKNTSLRLDKKTLKALKIRAIEEETSVQKLIERLIEEYLKNK